jgi:acetyl-CoA carboxylase carboxyl transferase subunit alpha
MNQREEVNLLEQQIEEFSKLNPSDETTLELGRLQERLDKLRKDIYAKLTPWQRVQMARHPQRPHVLDFVNLIFDKFSEMHGDRRFEDDEAMVGGMAWFHGEPCMVIGTQKGRDTKQKLLRNFGMPKPEGYRKAMRIMKLAEKYGRPIFSFIDTAGAYPGIGAEERGQAEAIAYNLREMSRLQVPLIVAITGEGGSGGALGIGVGDKVLILENAYYSVISPEGCAAILYKDQSRAEDAANALKITAKDLKKFGIVDEIVPEPDGGAHNNHKAAAEILDGYLKAALKEFIGMDPRERAEKRYQRFRVLGPLVDMDSQ